MNSIHTDLSSADLEKIDDEAYLTEEFLFLKDNIESIKQLEIETFYYKNFVQYINDYKDFPRIENFIDQLLEYIDNEYLYIMNENIQNLKFSINEPEDNENPEDLTENGLNDYLKIFNYTVELLMNNLPYIYLKKLLEDSSNLTESYEIINKDDLRDQLLKEVSNKITTIEKFDNMLKMTGKNIKNNNKQNEYNNMLDLLNRTSNKHLDVHYFAKEVISNTDLDKLQELCKRYLEKDHKNII